MTIYDVISYVSAVVFAALASAIAGASVSKDPGAFPLAFGIALAHAAVIGFPLFLLLRPRNMINVVSCTLGGFVVGMIPIGFLTWPRYEAGTSAKVGDVPTVIDGVTTAAGWYQFGEFLLFLGSFGAVGGFAFWLFLKFSGRLTKPST